MIIRNLLQRRTGASSSLRGHNIQWRRYSEGGPQKTRSGHAQWYSDIVPAMVPIFLLGSAVFLGLQLTQQKLSHEKFMEEASAQVAALEAEVDALQKKRASQTKPMALAVEAPKSHWRWW